MKLKRLLSIGVLFCIPVVMSACGGAGDTGGDPPPAATATPAPTATAVGTPTGDPVSATIGRSGGSLSSADGKIVLTVPAGALAADTVIGIQPLTNMAHGRIGAAYRLTPDRQQFQTPVTLTFPYTDQDLQGTAVEFLGAAFQTAEGFWQWVDDTTVDTAAKTVSVRTTHFTDYSKVKGIQIRPPSKAVKAGGTVALRVLNCFDLYQDQSGAILGYLCDSDDENMLPPLPPPPNTISEWSVNGVLGGSGATGRVSGSGATAIYTAPANRPNPSTVAVRARVQTRRGRTLVVSNITIVDKDSWVGTSRFSDPPVVIEATVVWKRVGEEASFARYVPEGTLSAHSTDPECTVTISESSIATGDGVLLVDFSVDPPTFRGQGVTRGEIGTACTDGSQSRGHGYPWFSGAGSVTENGTVIAGGDAQFSYRFTRP